MGTINVVPVFGNSFLMYFPIILILFVLSNFFNIWSKCTNKAARCMRALGLVNWTYGDSFDVEKIEEGRQLVKQARAKKSNITVLSDTGSAGTKAQSQIVSTFLFLVLRHFCSSISRSLGIYEFAPSRKEHALTIFIYREYFNHLYFSNSLMHKAK